MPSPLSSDPTVQPSGEDAVRSYLSITNTTNLAAARSALQTANGNLDLAIASYFDSTTSGQPTTSYAPLHVDDSGQSQSHALLSNRSNSPRGVRRAYEDARPRGSSKWFGFLLRIWTGPLRFLAVPVSALADLTLTVVGMFARLLGLRLPSISFHWPRGRPARPTDPRTCAERWVRELEEETGAETSVYALASSSSTSSSARRPKRRLPDFLLVGYEEAVAQAKEQLKVLMVVFVSEEHDDVAHFKRTTLMDDELLRTIEANHILVWGGDVRDRDACLAAHVLDVTTYPTIVFVALQTKRPSVGSGFSHRPTLSSQPVMAISTRLEGIRATSSSAVVSAITGTVVPRTTALLMRLRAERDRRAAERRLREEQDRAYAEAGRLDRERVLAKQAELAEKTRKEDEEARKLRAIVERREARKNEEDTRKRWRAWAVKERMPVEPTEGTTGVVTVGFRLGNGRRVVRRFLGIEPIESLYVFVELESAGMPSVTTVGELPDGYKHEFRFKLSTAMPRRTIPLEAGLTVESFGGLDGANVNVEGNVVGAESDDESDDEELDGDQKCILGAIAIGLRGDLLKPKSELLHISSPGRFKMEPQCHLETPQPPTNRRPKQAHLPIQSAQTYPPLLPLEGTTGIDTGYFAWPFEESLRAGVENTNQTRTIKKAIPTKSFFTFFSPPTPPGQKVDKGVPIV
ncbi:hypothetical protein CROQUDRAFT_108234 [Cronartium quercuum f. sp. fusiforme G11]|uniref:UBX domain-containing protein n=1 Tax=Cronartium quercuum f. sp. fusiforme G11 TaxID=708437 RepID=A0A9P6NJV0_9BASI|nr:hypothetical protein CROQUDRAFT_108234 [Cronartium quercuum f. sp. fusiforme G11]